MRYPSNPDMITDIWVRDLYPIGSDCTGPIGTDTDSTEDLDYNKTLLFSGGIDPSHLPMWIQHGKCVVQYPHSRLRVNTAFEVIVSKGLETAYTDKHSAYDIVRGPSGTGLTTGYFPEIQAIPGSNVSATIAYDLLHVNAWLDWLDGKVPEHSEGSLTTIPSFFAGNLQSVNVGQKVGGYENTSGFPFSPLLLEAIDSVDAAIGAVVSKLKAKGIYDDTLIIVAAKHGQAPIDPELYAKIDPAVIINNTGVPTQWITTDDIALIFLNDTADTATAVANLEKVAAEADIINIFSGAQIVSIGLADEAAPSDPAVPNIIVQPKKGIIYTTSTAKIAEHGGLGVDDRNVACFVSSPRLKRAAVTGRVNTTQIAPTIVEALGFSGKELQGAVAEGRTALPGLGLGGEGWADW